MSKNKKVERKFKITIISLSIALVLFLGAMVGVWAASTQTVKSFFSVNYDVGDNIAVGIRTEYYVPNMDANNDGVEDGVVTVTTDEQGNEVENDNGYVIYNAPDNTTEKYVYIGDFTLTPKMRTAIFYFTVESLMSEDYVRVILEQEFKTKENINIETYYYNTTTFNRSSSASTIADDDWTTVHYNNVTARGFKLIKVVVSIADRNQIAYCEGDITMKLDYSTVDGLTTLQTTKLSAYNGEPKIVFEYVNEKPSTVASLDAETEEKIWTYSDGTTFYIYSKYTIDLPTSCYQLFAGKTELTSLDFSNINSSNVTNMGYMFDGCTNLATIDFTNFDTSNVTSMLSMFRDCNALTKLDLSYFNTSKVKYFNSMFENCTRLNIDVSKFVTSSAINMELMFHNCDAITSLDLSNFDTSNVTSMYGMFWHMDNLEGLDLRSFYAPKVTNIVYMFQLNSKMKYLKFGNFDGSSLEKVNNSFTYLISLTELDLSSFKIKDAQSMREMFVNSKGVKRLNISNFDTSNVTDLYSMFGGCSSLTHLDFTNFNTANVTNMASMFCECASLTSLDLSNFDTSSVTSMSNMFSGCSGLTTLDLSNFDTQIVTDMDGMFYNCKKLTKIYIGDGWTTSAVESSTDMFTGCSVLQGAISYDSTKTDVTYANYTSGYLTYKED